MTKEADFAILSNKMKRQKAGMSGLITFLTGIPFVNVIARVSLRM